MYISALISAMVTTAWFHLSRRRERTVSRVHPCPFNP
jgi:hypothetical protein